MGVYLNLFKWKYLITLTSILVLYLSSVVLEIKRLGVTGLPGVCKLYTQACVKGYLASLDRSANEPVDEFTHRAGHVPLPTCSVYVVVECVVCGSGKFSLLSICSYLLIHIVCNKMNSTIIFSYSVSVQYCHSLHICSIWDWYGNAFWYPFTVWFGNQ